MVIGIGIDIIEIDRIRKSVEEFGERFLKRIYTETELDYCLKKKYKYQHLAARFAAKEAVYKALATLWNEDMSWHNIEISNQPDGMPIVTLHGGLKQFLQEGKELKVSMSHARDYVACMAIIYKTNFEK